MTNGLGGDVAGRATAGQGLFLQSFCITAVHGGQMQELEQCRSRRRVGRRMIGQWQGEAAWPGCGYAGRVQAARARLPGTEMFEVAVDEALGFSELAARTATPTSFGRLLLPWPVLEKTL